MTDRSDNDKEKLSRDTFSGVNRSWDELLSDIRKADDIEIHSFEDLGLDNDGIDFSSIPDADERHDAHHGNDVHDASSNRQSEPRYDAASAAAGYGSHTRSYKRDEFPHVSDIPDTNGSVMPDTHDVHDAPEADDFLKDHLPPEDDADHPASDDVPAADALKSSSEPPVHRGRKVNINDVDAMDMAHKSAVTEAGRAETEAESGSGQSHDPAAGKLPEAFPPADDTTGDNDDMTENTERRPAKKKRKKKKKTGMRRLFGLLFKLFLLLMVICAAYVGYVILTTPEIDTSNIYENISQSSIIYDDQGEVLESVATSQNRTNVEYSEMPKNHKRIRSRRR